MRRLILIRLHTKLIKAYLPVQPRRNQRVRLLPSRHSLGRRCNKHIMRESTAIRFGHRGSRNTPLVSQGHCSRPRVRYRAPKPDSSSDIGAELDISTFNQNALRQGYFQLYPSISEQTRDKLHSDLTKSTAVRPHSSGRARYPFIYGAITVHPSVD